MKIIPNFIKNTFTNNTTETYSCDYINKRNTYSTDEVFTGKYWIDGKKIYRTVTNFTSITINSGVNNFSTGISNMETLIDSKLYMEYNNTWFASWYDNGFKNQIYNSNGSILEVNVGSGLTAQQLVIITEYTKTTN